MASFNWSSICVNSRLLSLNSATKTLSFHHFHFIFFTNQISITKTSIKPHNLGSTMAVRPTMMRFPSEPKEHEDCGLPWGVTLRPFAAKDENGNPPVYGSGGDLLPRCENCWAYYNTFCEQDQWTWECALCGTTNGLSAESISRYSRPQSCPENMSSFIDLEMPCNCLISFDVVWFSAQWWEVWLFVV